MKIPQITIPEMDIPDELIDKAVAEYVKRNSVPKVSCKDCKYYIMESEGFKMCRHPASETDDPYTWHRLSMNPNDYCSHFLSKEGDTK